MNIKLISISLSIAGFFFISSCQNAPVEGDKGEGAPNIVIIFTDELSTDYLGPYGSKIPTPNLDRLADLGMVMNDAYCVSSMCTPARFNTLTGLYAGRCNARAFLQKYPINQPYAISWNTYIDQATPTLAKTLKDQGYFTGFAGKWHTGTPDRLSFGFPMIPEAADPALPEVDQLLKQSQRVLQQKVQTDGGFDMARSVLWENFDQVAIRSLRQHNMEWITNGAMEFLDSAITVDKPFFLWTAVTAVHGPNHFESLGADAHFTPGGKISEPYRYHPPRDTLKAAIEGSDLDFDPHVQAGVMQIDDHVGAILGFLEEKDIQNNTIVVFMADHGLEPAKATCYQYALPIPMIIHWPGKLPEGSSSMARVQNVDILPTLVENINLSYPEGYLPDGQNFITMKQDHRYVIREKDTLYFENGFTRALWDGRYKYIGFRYPGELISAMENGSEPMAINQVNMRFQPQASISMIHYPHYFDADQLYDLENDPNEQFNLADNPEYQQRLDQMKNGIRPYLETLDHPFPAEADPFRSSERYQQLVIKAREEHLEQIPWWWNKNFEFSNQKRNEKERS